jgi:formylglycine-generating enzyme required for sulfatase activity
MLLALKIKAIMAVAALAAPVALAVAPTATDRRVADPIFADIPATNYQYRVAGDFSQDGKPAEAPLRNMRLRSDLKIMNRHVTASEYAACAREGACPSIAHKAAAADRPIVGVSWRDATAYAEWITRKTGILHRLPTDEEWVAAAGEKAANETLPPVDPADPAQAWIARYDTEANRARPFALDPQPVGTFGHNRWGLRDVGGNVWEWTNTCFLRFSIEPSGSTRIANTNCGVRVVQGAHRAYMTDFIRDPRTGGCAAGVPPANLGFRLVAEDETLPAFNRIVERAFTLIAISFRSLRRS